jgi:photosystem II stability/assembly factor-like uncharacterized protein
MRIRTAIHAVVLLALCALGASANVDNGGHDPLFTPAASASFGMRSQLVSVATAGSSVVAVGRRGVILISSDRGASWRQVASPTSADLTSVRFSDATHGWITGHDALVLKTLDGGLSWERKLDGAAVLKLLQATYGAHGTAPNAAIAQDIERAASQSATSGVLPYPLLDAWFTSFDDGFVAGAFGLLLHTTDGGASWTPWLERSENTRMNHIYSISGSADALYLAGEQGFLRRLDADGQRFGVVKIPYEGSFFGLYASNSLLVAHGLRGNAFVSRDGGAAWRKVETGINANIIAALPGTDPGAGLVLVSQAGDVLAVPADGGAVQALRATRAGEVYGATFDRGTLVTTGLAGIRAQAIAALHH